MTKILNCFCESEFQDVAYGKGRRVHNFAPKGSGTKNPAWRCTVCKATKVASTDDSSVQAVLKKQNKQAKSQEKGVVV